MPVTKQSISMPEPVIAAMRARDSQLSTAVTQSLMRYVALLAAARRELRDQISELESALILDACNGTAFVDMMSVRIFPEGIADAIDLDGLDRKWEVDGVALMVKLRATTLTQRMALVDAVQRWWDGEQPNRVADYGALLAEPEADQALTSVF